MTSLPDTELAEAIGRAAERYVRTHRQGSMATVSATILFDALRRDFESTGRRSVTAFSRPQLRDAMAAHPSWQGKAFEETSFNTVPEDLGEQLEGFSHEDFAGARRWVFRFRGPTRKFRNDKTSRELFLEVDYQPLEELATTEPKPSRSSVVMAALLAVLICAAVATYFFSFRSATAEKTGPLSIAILPFNLVSNDRQLEFLQIGMADAVITELANHHQMRVRPTAAILRYRGTDVDLRRAADEQEVDFLLTGNVQEAGDRLRTSVQLLRSSDLSTVWGQRFDVERGNTLALQDDIARQVAEALQLRAEPIAAGGTTESAAFELYLQGRATMFRRGPETKLLEAIDFYERAIKADPGYARAWSGIAFAAANMQYFTMGTPESEMWKARGESAAKRAVELGPDLAETHEALAEVYSAAEFHWDKAIDEDRRAVALNPSLAQAHATLAAAFGHLGMPDEARAELNLLEKSNPLARGEIGMVRASTEVFAGDTTAAQRQYERAAAYGADPAAAWAYPVVRFRSGDEKGALNLLAQETKVFRVARAQAIAAAIHASRGRRAEAEQRIRAVLDNGYIDHHVAYYLGAAYAGLADNISAARELRQAVAIGFPALPSYERDPFLESFRRSKEGESFMRDLRGQWTKTRARYAQ